MCDCCPCRRDLLPPFDAQWPSLEELRRRTREEMDELNGQFVKAALLGIGGQS